MTKKLLYVCMSALVLTGCSSDEPEQESAAAPVALPLSITSGNNYAETYAYDRNGRIRQWHLTETAGETLINYEYLTSNTISVTTVQKLTGGEERHYTNNITLDSNGRARSCDGVMRSFNGTEQTSELIYSQQYVYDIIGQLCNIENAQWQRNEDLPTRHTDTIDWSNGNPTRYTYIGIGSYYTTETYTYYTNASETYKPIVVPALSQFGPLQRCGVFGKLPKNLVMTKTTESEFNLLNNTETYSYNFTTAPDKTYISSYTVTTEAGKSAAYNITWDL